MAVRGEYLLAPRPGFVAGYDAVGVVEIVPDGVAHLHVGQRVAAVLPGMGAHARRVSVSPSLLVPIPDELESAAASTVALDALTAHFALAALGARAGSVLIQGAGGAVGSWATQLAIGRGLAVWGRRPPVRAGTPSALALGCWTTGIARGSSRWDFRRRGASEVPSITRAIRWFAAR